MVKPRGRKGAVPGSAVAEDAAIEDLLEGIRRMGPVSDEKRENAQRSRKKVKPEPKGTVVKPPRVLSRDNHVCTIQMIHKHDPAFVFSPMVLVNALCGAYAHKGFACVTQKQRDPKVCCHVYDTGLIVACGARTEPDAVLAMYRVMFRLMKLFGWPLYMDHYRVTNYVMSCALGVCLDLPRIYSWLGGLCSYDPEFFCGLQYYPNRPKKCPCIIMFASGNIVIVGSSGPRPVETCATILSKIPLFVLLEDRVAAVPQLAATVTSAEEAVYWPLKKLVPAAILQQMARRNNKENTRKKRQERLLLLHDHNVVAGRGSGARSLRVDPEAAATAASTTRAKEEAAANHAGRGGGDHRRG
jgi:TATA-box binding protein (TBP) (component of TFIID and TFIIIB)